MADKICMNELCKAKTTLQWKKGWGFKSGGFATLCYNCGSAYENSVYCETFHVEESGWRECRYCRKHIHCGCIASKSLHDFLDFGGIVCISCAKGLQTRSMRPIQISNDDIPNGFGTLTTNNLGDQQSSVHEKRMDGISVDNGKVVQPSKSKEEKNLSHFLQTQKGETSSSMGQVNQEDIMCPIGEAITGFSDLMQQPVGSSMFSSPNTCMKRQGVKDMYESVAQPSLKFSLSTPLSTPNSALPFPGGIVEGREQGKVPPFQQGPRTRHILPKPPKSGLTLGPEANKGFVSQTRVARPPAEGRGRNQLLPRYWPRITDQELQQLSGDLNSNIVPLFEKVLSASDAGRIGRLVLPKACAEAYFPPISQSEGLPLRIQDIKGKEWTFQFRFWPNNNSRMYVLEGVTPCIQNMQLQAGDTVTFSRIDPGGELVMGFRKASNSVDVQEDQTYVPPNGALSGETSIFNVNENLPTHAGRKNENSVQRPMLIPEKKRTRNIGSKSKRLLMHSEDAVELRVTWGEAQELLRSPPCEPTVFMVGDHEFEEYDDPPVFGKRTIFRAQPSGEQEQWAQCDSCSKWRKLPVDVLLPPKWMCSDNIWDSGRCSCSAPDEMNPKELECFFRVGKGTNVKKRRLKESHKVAQECEPSGLDALATAAVLGDNTIDSGEPSVGVTTRHPRHRPGCSCIVCIQPPSGKGKHKPTCICNVCMTVKRRFKTLMMRKKKRQSEREAEVAQGRVQQVHLNDEPEMEDTSGHALQQMDHSDNERSRSRIHIELGESSKGQLDLNYHPNREEDQSTEATGANITSLVHEASFPLQMYLRQNGFAGFLGASLPSPTADKSEDHPPDEECLASVLLELENKDDGT